MVDDVSTSIHKDVFSFSEMDILFDMEDFIKNINSLEQRINSIPESPEGYLPISDGIIYPEEYLPARYRILWLLKEPYVNEAMEDFGGWSLTENLNNKKNWSESYNSKRIKNYHLYFTWNFKWNFRL